MDYVYYEEVKLYQEQLASFLESAQNLEIEGLLDNNQEKEDLQGEDEFLDKLMKSPKDIVKGREAFPVINDI